MAGFFSSTFHCAGVFEGGILTDLRLWLKGTLVSKTLIPFARTRIRVKLHALNSLAEIRCFIFTTA
jgi:hypothetical protein